MVCNRWAVRPFLKECKLNKQRYSFAPGGCYTSYAYRQRIVSCIYEGEVVGWKRPFFTLWFGQAFSLLGSQLVQFALVWWLTKTTGSATVLATASLVALLPNIFLSPFAGPLIDRWNRRIVMLVADSGIALVTLGLIGVFAAGEARPWVIYLVMLVRAVGGVFQMPAMNASTSLMVPTAELGRVQGMNAALNGSMTIVAPPLGALLIDVLPMQAVLSVDILTAILGVGALAAVHVPQPVRAAARGALNMRRELGEALRHMWDLPGLMILVSMAVAINFVLIPAGTLLPLLVRDYFGGGAQEFGWMESAFGIGVVAGGVVLSVWGGFKRKIVTSQVGVVGIGVAHMVLGVTPETLFAAALASVFVAGFMTSFNGAAYAVLQSTIAPEMQGRVFTLITSLATGVSPLSLAVAGPLADQFGVRFWYLVGGIVCVLMGSIALMIPSVVNAERLAAERMALQVEQA
jgi:DHA3 family macrolide efflux protein-like MFS transporter